MFNIYINNKEQFEQMIFALDPFQKGDVYEVEYNTYTQLTWLS